LAQKGKFRKNLVNVKWFLDRDKPRPNKTALKVGQRRENGRRDRFVDLPIAFIPTRKSVHSQHHLSFEQNNESIYIPKSEIFSLNALGVSGDQASQVTSINKCALSMFR
jgi:hypothetical protein